MDAAIVTLLVSYSTLEVLQFWTIREIVAFLKTTSSIGNVQDLERLKAVARRNMYFALFQIPIWFVGLVASIVIINRYGSAGLAGVVIVNLISMASSLMQRKHEVRARTLPATSQELEQERSRVANSWVKRPLPDF